MVHNAHMLTANCQKMELSGAGIVLDKVIGNPIAQLSMDSLPVRLGGSQAGQHQHQNSPAGNGGGKKGKGQQKDLLRHQPHRTEKEMDKKVMGPTPKVTMGPTQKKGKDPEKAKRQLRQNQLRRKRMDKLKSLIQVRPKTS